jgi:hypothetical protein
VCSSDLVRAFLGVAAGVFAVLILI